LTIYIVKIINLIELTLYYVGYVIRKYKIFMQACSSIAFS